jgi:hypothetical protein
MSDPHTERKRLRMLEALATGRMVRVFFTPDTEGVVIPEWIKDRDAAMLDFGRRAPTPITDLKCDQNGISGTLRFGGDYIWCSIPWLAVVTIEAHGPTPAARAWTLPVIQGGKN